MKEKKAKNEERTWELWLHKVFDKTYGDFLEEGEAEQKRMNTSKGMEEEEIRNAINVAGNTLKLLQVGGDAE